MKVLRKQFFIIQNGELQRFEWTDQDAFIEANLKKHLYGDVARVNGEAPIKGVFTFKSDGNIQGIRGDKYTGDPVQMVRNLVLLCRRYYMQDVVHEVRIYDNRNLLPVQTNLILHWHQVKGTLINYLPFYSGEFDLNKPHVAKSNHRS